jgi:hypothetical protein
MNKILDVMEDIKQNITDNQYKIIMDSLMEIKNGKEKEERVTRLYYTQKEFDDMTKVMVKLSIDIFFEYTDDENDVVWYDTIVNLTRNELESHHIGFEGNKLEIYISEILKKNNAIQDNIFFRKIKHRK